MDNEVIGTIVECAVEIASTTIGDRASSRSHDPVIDDLKRQLHESSTD